MADQPENLEAKLQEVEDAIAALRKALDGAALQGALAPLLEKRERYEALLEGSGAVAQGAGATAASERGIATQGNIKGHAVTGDGMTINPDPVQSAAERARRRYLERVHQQCNVLPLAAMGGEEGVGEEVSLDQVYVDLDTKTRVPLTEEEKAAREDEFSFLTRGEDRESRSAGGQELFVS